MRRDIATAYGDSGDRRTTAPSSGSRLRALASRWRSRGRSALPEQERFPHTLVHPNRMPSFEELSEVYPDDRVPPLDREDVDESRLTWDELHWRRHGFLVLNRFLPDDRIRDYLALRDRLGIGLGGFENTVHAGTDAEILALGCYPSLLDVIRQLFSEELRFNFSLTQFTSTNRAWHQDDYLGADMLYGRYCAVWMALDDIHPDAGPFQFIPGSHRWQGMRGRLVREHLRPEVRAWNGLPGDGGHWAAIAEPFTTPAFEAKIAKEGLPQYTFHARKGDVLIWHGRLVHRGSIANVPGMRRPALICHYYPRDLDTVPASRPPRSRPS
jgi:hypothetical protein